MNITGKQFIAGDWLIGNDGTFNAYNPVNGEYIEPNLSFASKEQVSKALFLAEQAASPYANLPELDRAHFLNCCAKEVMALGDDLFQRAMLETGYSDTRIKTERTRIVNQLQLFAKLIISGDYLDARINTALPNRQPSARSDIRSVNKALGPVVVFGASNFPLAYSVLGGDTVAALAAGCPVIVKGHNSHPGTSELIAQAIDKALLTCQLPKGVFSLLFGKDNDIGEQLVSADIVKAVGFTGSTNGGCALMHIAEQRKEPIPIFAEMGSSNPVILLPKTLQKNAKAIAAKFVTSLTEGTGQFCVNPGLLLAIENREKNQGLTQFVDEVKQILSHTPAGVMLNQDIYQRYLQASKFVQSLDGVELVASGQLPLTDTGCFTQALLFKVTAETFIKTNELKDEIFGHAALLITCQNMDELQMVIKSLPGQLTGTIQGTEQELTEQTETLTLLQQKVGRLVINNFPTGVEVCEAMVHGGPFPAASDIRFTSVGTAAIKRFIRPVCLQNHPDVILPDSLKNNNPLNITRLVNGVYTKDHI